VTQGRCPGDVIGGLAAALATELGLPFLSKDEIKEALMDGLGRPETVTRFQQLGRAAVLRPGIRKRDPAAAGAE